METGNLSRMAVAVDTGDKLEILARAANLKDCIAHLKTQPHGTYTLITFNRVVAVGEPKRSPRAVVSTVSGFGKPRGKLTEAQKAQRASARAANKKNGKHRK